MVEDSGETIARSFPAKALTSELLPALVRPIRQTGTPSRSGRSVADFSASAAHSSASFSSSSATVADGSFVEFVVLEIENRLDGGGRFQQFVDPLLHRLCGAALQSRERRQPLGLAFGCDQPLDRLGLPEVNPPVEEGAEGELPRLGVARTPRRQMSESTARNTGGDPGRINSTTSCRV